MTDNTPTADIECRGRVEVSTLGDVLRSCDPDAIAYPTPEVQTVIVAALDWFVVEAPTIAAAHCAAATDLPIPDLAPPRITIDRVLRPTSLRSNVTPLRRAVEAGVRPGMAARRALPEPHRRRVSGIDAGGTVEINQHYLGDLVEDFVFARAWCTTLGTKAGYWAYRWVGHCMEMCAVANELARAQLADALIESAEQCFTDAMDAMDEQLAQTGRNTP